MIVCSLRRLALFLTTTAFAQSPGVTPPPATPAPSFTAADVQVGTRMLSPFAAPPFVHGERYVLRDASMVSLISTAYGVEPSSIQGGPSWLELDNFDIVARAPRGTPPATLKLMLQSLLRDRFSLVVHNGTAPMPAYVLTADNPKLKPSDGSGESVCSPERPPADQPPGAIFNNTFNCHNMTSDQLAQNLRWMGDDYIYKPIVNQTNLKGAYDFQLVWTDHNQLAKAGSDGISIFDALRKLGLKLELQTAPRPVLIVDSVNENPTPNAPDIAKLLPPPPPAQFDVAIIKPTAPGDQSTGGIRGDQINLTNVPLKFLLGFAWDINPFDSQAIAGAPPWLDKDRFNILAKVAPDDANSGRAQGEPPMDFEQLRVMLRNLLIERFQIKTHTENRPVDAYTLRAVAPKLKPADPTARTKCTEGPGPDGKDPRLANPALNRLLSCQNVTMAQFGQMLPSLAGGYIYAPVVDATVLKGSWDFTLSFSAAGQQVPGATPAASTASPSDTASDPNGAVTLNDAVRKQLGLKLDKQKRPLPVLVIDQINEKPTED